MNVNGLRQDKHYMEKSMEAVKARNIELEALAQKVQVGHSIIYIYQLLLAIVNFY